FGAALTIGAIAAALSGISTWLLIRTADTRATVPEVERGSRRKGSKSEISCFLCQSEQRFPADPAYADPIAGRSLPGATGAFSQRPLPRAFRRFIGPISKARPGVEGCHRWVVRGMSVKDRLQTSS